MAQSGGWGRREPLALPEGYRRRVVVRFRADVHLPYEDHVQGELLHLGILPWDDITADFGPLSLDRVFFSLTELQLSTLEARARHNHPDFLSPSFRRFFQVECPPEKSAEQLVARLESYPVVERAYVATAPTGPPDVNPNDPLAPHQRYLEAAPVGPAGTGGVDGYAAWTFRGGNGAGVSFVDIEQGWNLNHEDLNKKRIGLLSGRNHAWKGHGTSVLGIVLARDNRIGCIGMAPAARGHLTSQWRGHSRRTFQFNTEDALLSVADAVPPGSIVLIEAQTDYNLPMEVEDAIFLAIELLTWGVDITVVECAGNGILNLDAHQDASGRYAFHRGTPGFRDSGAIMVAASTSGLAAAPPAARSRIGFSNYGTRADCYAWGETVVTTGDGAQGAGNADYLDLPNGFGGTSAAGAIIAGVAVCVQGIARAAPFGGYLRPHEMRRLLSDPAFGTASDQPNVDRIGSMPNLHRIGALLATGFPLPY